jgi:hypothetical protein
MGMATFLMPGSRYGSAYLLCRQVESEFGAVTLNVGSVPKLKL